MTWQARQAYFLASSSLAFAGVAAATANAAAAMNCSFMGILSKLRGEMLPQRSVFASLAERINAVDGRQASNAAAQPGVDPSRNGLVEDRRQAQRARRNRQQHRARQVFPRHGL